MQQENGNIKELSFPRNVVGNLPLSGLLLKEEKRPYFMQKVEDPRQKPSGMTPNFMGFTLIELLVVVLIIGILAAVALPQYQKAVIKTRYATLKNLTHSIAQAQEVYYLANGKYAKDFEELSIEMPAGKLDTSTANQYEYDWGYCRLAARQVMCNNSAARMQYQMYLQNISGNQGIRQCVSFVTGLSAPQRQVCKNETRAAASCFGEDYCIYNYPN